MEGKSEFDEKAQKEKELGTKMMYQERESNSRPPLC